MKERLTGAIILVALIVLLVPELLTGPIRKRSAPAAAATVASAPAVGAGRVAHAEPPLRSYTLTLGSAPPARESVAPAAQGPAQPAEKPLENPPESASQSPPPAAENADPARLSKRSTGPESRALQVAKSPARQALREARASASSGGWVVQLGSFASRQNADRLARSLEGRGFRMSVSPARAGTRVLWRVRAGPARDRAGAQHLAARLHALGHRGELIPVR